MSALQAMIFMAHLDFRVRLQAEPLGDGAITVKVRIGELDTDGEED